MGEERHCRQCGATLPSDGPDEFCPNCIIDMVTEGSAPSLAAPAPAPAAPSATAPTSVPAAPRPRVWQRPVPLVLAAAALVVITGFVLWAPTDAAPGRRPLAQFVIATPSNGALRTGGVHPEVAISPDGTRIVYGAGGPAQGRQLYLRVLGRLDATPLRGTEGGSGPAFSPDGEWVGFLAADNTLRKVSVLGGTAVTIHETGSPVRGLSWGANDAIVFGSQSGLMRVPAGGGEPEPLTFVEHERGETAHIWPDVLPNGRGILFTIWSGSAEDSHLAVVSLETGEVVHLLAGGSHPRYSSSGHIVYGVGGTLWAVGFDADRLAVTTDRVPVVEHLNTKDISGAASFGLAHDGSLVYVAGGVTDGISRRSLAWVDRQGREEPLGLPPRGYDWPRVSPDGRRLALNVLDPENVDVWILDVDRQATTRLTFDAAHDLRPVWTPDGQRVIFASRREGHTQLLVQAADGTGVVEPLVDSEIELFPHSISPDGRLLVVEARSPEGAGTDLSLLSLDGDREALPLLRTEFTERNAEISPDGRWIAYESNASGRFEVYVQPFPDLDDGKWMVSADGGTRPLWSPDGHELFFLDPDGRLMVVPVETNESFRPGIPEVLMDNSFPQTPGRNYDVAPDGRFLVVRDAGATDDPATEHRVVLVQNWLWELQRLVPTP